MVVETTITKKLRLDVSPEDVARLHRTAESYRAACGFVSGVVFDSGNENVVALHRRLYGVLRADFGLKAQMAQSVLKTVVARYRTVRSNGHKRTRIRFRVPQYDLVYNRDWSIIGGMFSVNTLDGRIKLPAYSGPFGTHAGKYGTAKLVVDKRNRVFLHVPVTIQVEVPDRRDVTHVVGIDRGIRQIVATYDGRRSTFISGAPIKSRRAKFAKVRKELQQRGTPSARRRLRKIGSRENRWMSDVNHCIAKALVNSNPVGTLFVLEDLAGVRTETERVRVKDRYVSVSWSYYDLGAKLGYKAALAGQAVLTVPPAYTSQRCPVCGAIDKHSRNKSNHFYRCTSCGYGSNDDRVGAMNLYQLGLDYLNGNDNPCIQSPSGKPVGGGCSQSPCDVTPRRKAIKGGGAKPDTTPGQLQARDFSHE